MSGKRIAACLALFIVSIVPAQAQSLADGPQLAKDNICMGCHQVDRMRVGPPFMAIADRYQTGNEQMVSYLANSIRKGGRGRWGAVPMPAQPQVTEDEALALASWILSLAAVPDGAK